MLPVTLRGWAFACMVLAGAVAIGVPIGIVISDLGAPVELISQEDVGYMAQHDDRIWIRNRINRTRRCLADNSHFLITELSVAGRMTTVVIPVTQDGPVPFEGLGTSEYVLSLQKPAGLFPARWQFVTKSEDRCGLFGSIWPHRSQTVALDIDIEQIRAAVGTPVTVQHQDGSKTERSRSPLNPAVKP